MTAIDYEKSIVALACWHALHAEGYRGMLFGAMVLRNRATAKWFNGSLFENAVAELNKETFGPVFPDARDPDFQNLLTGMDGIFSGRTDDRTDGALYWAPLAEEGTYAGTRTAQLGRYVFIR